ncbi:MAG: circumsporozoite protein [Sphingomicrobium sp.]
MKLLSFALVGAAGLLLAACSGNSEDAVNADANAADMTDLNAFSGESMNDAANLESDTLANQAAQLNESDDNASTNADVPATSSDDEAMNVAGM